MAVRPRQDFVAEGVPDKVTKIISQLVFQISSLYLISPNNQNEFKKTRVLREKYAIYGQTRNLML